MTEEEAKTKWCPVIGLAGAIFSIGHAPDATYKKCIGSACAMWRNTYSCAISYDLNESTEADAKIIGGYCGLAGKP